MCTWAYADYCFIIDCADYLGSSHHCIALRLTRCLCTAMHSNGANQTIEMILIEESRSPAMQHWRKIDDEEEREIGKVLAPNRLQSAALIILCESKDVPRRRRKNGCLRVRNFSFIYRSFGLQQ